MNANHIIEQIKRPPKDERKKVFEYVHKTDEAVLVVEEVATGPYGSRVRGDALGARYATDEDARLAAEEVFDQHPELFPQAGSVIHSF